MSKLLDRVGRFIALSASPSEEEARTSAFLACKLIREHKLVVAEAPVEAEEVPKKKRRRTPSWEEWAPAHPPTHSPVGHQGTIMRSDHEGVCAECNLSYIRGSRIVSSKGAWVHLRCWRHE